MTRHPHAAVLFCALAGCVAEPRVSGHGESCAFAAHCGASLVCIDNRCTPHDARPSLTRTPLDAAPDRGPPPRRPGFAEPPPATPTRSFLGWRIGSSGAPRVAATLVDKLTSSDPSALTRTCSLTEPLTVTFRYRFVRAQYAADDHGQLSATVTSGGTASERACLPKTLTEQSILGRMELGRRPFRLEARFHPSQEPSP